MYLLQFDGMLRSTNGDWPDHIGLLGYGWLIERNNIEIAHGFGVFARRCMVGSNVAEYLALIGGLEALADLRLREEVVEIRGDAKCVIDQMIGQAAVSSPLTVEFHQRAQHLAKLFRALTWTWVPRRENRRADSLSRRSLRYLRDASHLDQEIHRSQHPAFYGGRLVPLVDLRIHNPIVQLRNHSKNL